MIRNLSTYMKGSNSAKFSRFIFAGEVICNTSTLLCEQLLSILVSLNWAVKKLAVNILHKQLILPLICELFYFDLFTYFLRIVIKL